MGKENNIKTGTIHRKSHGGVSMSTFNLKDKLPSSVYQFGIVNAINPDTREIGYIIIEDNVSTGKVGTAKPLYPNRIQLPDIGYVIPLLRGPDIGISTTPGRNSKTMYYLDPIGIWQNVDDNSIRRSTTVSNKSPESNVSKADIIKSNIGIPHGK
jgi:hypothetical protein